MQDIVWGKKLAMFFKSGVPSIQLFGFDLEPEFTISVVKFSAIVINSGQHLSRKSYEEIQRRQKANNLPDCRCKRRSSKSHRFCMSGTWMTW